HRAIAAVSLIDQRPVQSLDADVAAEAGDPSRRAILYRNQERLVAIETVGGFPLAPAPQRDAAHIKWAILRRIAADEHASGQALGRLRQIQIDRLVDRRIRTDPPLIEDDA